MLSEKDVTHFFMDILNFPQWKQVKEAGTLVFLKELIKRYQYYCYFHSIEMMSTPPEKRRPPVVEDSFRIGLAGSGGVCIHQNQFMTLILQALGFNSFTTAGKCVGSDSEGEGNHCMCILKISDEEIYALDVGCGQPVDEPIPLHKLPYQGVYASFRYEYRYNQVDNLYEKWQLDGTFFRGKYKDPEKTELRYSFSLEPQGPEYFNRTLTDIFTNADTSIFLRCPFLFRSLDLESDAKTNPSYGRRFILIFGASVVTFDKVNREVTNFTSYKELYPTIIQNFPKLDHDLVAKALDYCTSISTEVVLGRGCE